MSDYGPDYMCEDLKPLPYVPYELAARAPMSTRGCILTSSAVLFALFVSVLGVKKTQKCRRFLLPYGKITETDDGTAAVELS